MGLRAGMDGCRKSCPPPGLDPRTVQAVASRLLRSYYRCVCVCVFLLGSLKPAAGPYSETLQPVHSLTFISILSPHLRLSRPIDFLP